MNEDKKEIKKRKFEDQRKEKERNEDDGDERKRKNLWNTKALNNKKQLRK